MDQLVQILAEIKNEPDLAGKIGPDTDIINGLGLDSLQMINLALQVEEAFNITIDFETFDFDTLLSVQSFYQYIEREAAGAASGGQNEVPPAPAELRSEDAAGADRAANEHGG